MKLGIIADDFTGASDIALTVAEAGMTVAQFNGVPTTAAAPGLDAGVVALKSRTAPVSEAVAQSLAACEWLLAQGVEQIVLKVCSTFDSTDKGNIGPVLDALSTRLNAQSVLVCPAFPENGRSVYQGHLFVGDRLLNDSGMQDHPLTPMRDADLCRILAAQSDRAVSLIPIPVVMAGAGAVVDALPATGYTIADAIRDEDLLTLGQAALGMPLICGGSGIALGLPANFGARAAPPPWRPITGPGVVLSGSCSRATRTQVALYKDLAPSREISAEAILNGTETVPQICDWVLSQTTPPLVYSSADPARVAAVQNQLGQGVAAETLEGFFADLAAQLRDAGIRRMIVAGGETSGAVVQSLEANVLDIGPRLAAGVPMLSLPGTSPMALALKSGNFGEPMFFADALRRMEGQDV